jgi:FkbM family methyltransferase
MISPLRNYSSWIRSLNFYKKFRVMLPSSHYLKSYSQEGEDLILRRIFAGQKKGFYIDVGAHHPKRFSNTYIFYHMGWQGINIDARPGSMTEFRRLRARDINLEIGVSESEGALNYYQFEESALNGFSIDLSLNRAKLGVSRLISESIVQTLPLKQILSNHMHDTRIIDFLTIDVEGMDLEVLRSNDWNKFRPKIVLVEVLASSLDTFKSHPVNQFMNTKGYRMYSKAMNTAFFMADEHLALMEQSI